MRDQVIEVISRVMKVPIESLTDDSGPDNVPSWDSMTHVSLVLSLEKAFDVRFTGSELAEFVNVGQIVNFLAAGAKNG